jgi:hypothetical protein
MMVPRLGKATWRASNRASASTREQGEALGAHAAAGVRASADAPSSPSHRSLTRVAARSLYGRGRRKGNRGKMTCGPGLAVREKKKGPGGRLGCGDGPPCWTG